jgi:hypothetical protein
MKQFAAPPRDVVVTDPAGKPILGGDHDRRFFEAAWVFKRAGKYYFTYSTGDTHFLAYAIGDNPYGPFRYTGSILSPVQGWTTHHSIVKFKDRWWLFYHDTQLSGKNHLRSAKMTELSFNPDGTIRPIDTARDPPKVAGGVRCRPKGVPVMAVECPLAESMALGCSYGAIPLAAMPHT